MTNLIKLFLLTTVTAGCLFPPCSAVDRVPLVTPDQIDSIFTNASMTKKQGIQQVQKSLSLMAQPTNYHQLNSDLLNVENYPHLTPDTYKAVWRILLTDLTFTNHTQRLLDLLPDGPEFYLPTDFLRQSDSILYVMSRVLLPFTEDHSMKFFDDKKAQNVYFFVTGKPCYAGSNMLDKLTPSQIQQYDQTVKNYNVHCAKYLYPFCRAMTFKQQQFLIANSSKAITRGNVTLDFLNAQDDTVLSILDICKAHLGAAPTLVASTLLTVMAVAVTAFCFI